jgi:hypothetical protein
MREAILPKREPGKKPVQIAPVRQIARASSKPKEIDDWYTDNGSGQSFGRHITRNTSHDLNPVQLVAVNTCGKAQYWARSITMRNDHRTKLFTARVCLVRVPKQPTPRSRPDRATQHEKRLTQWRANELDPGGICAWIN